MPEEPGLRRGTPPPHSGSQAWHRLGHSLLPNQTLDTIGLRTQPRETHHTPAGRLTSVAPAALCWGLRIGQRNPDAPRDSSQGTLPRAPPQSRPSPSLSALCPWTT